MRLIDADALIEKIDTEREILVKDGRLGTEHILVHYVREFIEDAPTIGTLEGCEGCKHWVYKSNFGEDCEFDNLENCKYEPRRKERK